MGNRVHGHRVHHLLVELRIAFGRGGAILGQQVHAIEVDRLVPAAAGRVDIEHHDEVPHLLGGMHEHAAELSTAHDAQGRTGRDEGGHVS